MAEDVEKVAARAGDEPVEAPRTDALARGQSVKRDSSERGWVANFAAILLCHLFIFAMFNSIMPFIPLYLRELGEDESGAVFWAGFMQSTSAVVLFFTTPLWGALADKAGRKAMVIRAVFGSAVTFVGMAFAQQAWQMWGLRMLQGATAGTNSAVLALAASTVPPSRLGMSMGFLQTAQFLGLSIGPLFGGLVSAAIGYRGSFLVASLSLVGIALLMVFLVKEPPRVAAASGPRPSLAERLRIVARAPRLRAPILTVLLFQTGYSTGLTLLPLQLANILGDGSEASAAATAGVVITATALGIAIGASVIGWLGGKTDVWYVALVCLVLTAVLTLPQVWLRETWQFAGVRFVMGFAAGGVLPSLRAAIGLAASRDERTSGNIGAVYGLTQSAFAGGTAIGPALASAVASAWGLPFVHAASSAVFLVAAAWLLRAARSRGVAAAAVA